MGQIFELGSTASTLANSGQMTAGNFGTVGEEDESAIATSTFTGRLDQMSDGTLWVDYDFSQNTDLIDVTSGSASLAGAVYANPVANAPTNQETGVLSREDHGIVAVPRTQLHLPQSGDEQDNGNDADQGRSNLPS